MITHLLIFMFRSRKEALSNILFVCLLGMMEHNLKLFFHEARPYMLDSRIKMEKCLYDFGFPSGHMIANTALPLNFFLEYSFKPNGEEIKRKTGEKVTFMLLCILHTLSIAFNRLYVGAHSLD